MGVGAEKIYIKCPDVIERMIDGEAVLLDLKTGVYYSLNEVGSEIWKLIDGERSVRDVVQWVLENHEVERAAAEQDVNELLDDLCKEKLIKTKE